MEPGSVSSRALSNQTSEVISPPRDADRGGNKRIKRLTEVCCLAAYKLHELCKDGRTESAVDGYSFAIGAD